MPFLGVAVGYLIGSLAALIIYGVKLLAELVGHLVSRFLPGFLKNLTGNWVDAMSQAAHNAMDPMLNSLAAQMLPPITAPALALNALLTSTANALLNHRAWIHNITDIRLPDILFQAEDYAVGLYNITMQRINIEVTYLNNLITQVQQYLDQLIWQVYNLLIAQIAYVQTTLLSYINNWVGFLEGLIQLDYKTSITYTQQVGQADQQYAKALYDSAESDISDTRNWLLAYITTTATFITTVAIPGAIAAYTATMTAAIAVVTDVLWPFVFKSLGVASIRLLTSLPQVSARMADVPPEPIPGIPGTFEAVTGALGFLAGVTESATVPLWLKLHDVADEIDGVGSLLLDGSIIGFVVAAIADPIAMADDTERITYEPIAGLLQDVANIIGSI